MYCKCGTKNSDDALSCVTCGRSLVEKEPEESSTDNAPNSVPSSNEANPPQIVEPVNKPTSLPEPLDFSTGWTGHTSQGSNISKFMLMGLVATAVFMIPMMMFTWGKRSMPQAQKESMPKENTAKQERLIEILKKNPQNQPEFQDFAPNRPGFDFPASPEAAMNMANDAGRKANAHRLFNAIAQITAETGNPPATLLEISEGQIGFVPDPNIYEYKIEGSRFRVAVVVESGGGMEEDNIVIEDGLLKYVLVGEI